MGSVVQRTRIQILASALKRKRGIKQEIKEFVACLTRMAQRRERKDFSLLLPNPVPSKGHTELHLTPALKRQNHSSVRVWTSWHKLKQEFTTTYYDCRNAWNDPTLLNETSEHQPKLRWRFYDMKIIFFFFADKMREGWPNVHVSLHAFTDAWKNQEKGADFTNHPFGLRVRSPAKQSHLATPTVPSLREMLMPSRLHGSFSRALSGGAFLYQQFHLACRLCMDL